MDSWMAEVFDPAMSEWPLFEYRYSLDRGQIKSVFDSIIDWLNKNDGSIYWVQVPNTVLAIQGKHTLFGWNKNAKKYLIIELSETVFGTQVNILAAPTLAGVTEVRSMSRETKEAWALLLEDFFQGIGDRRSVSRISSLRLRHDSELDECRELANKMIAVLPVLMTLALVATFLMWLLSARAGASYLEVPQIISMTVLLILWQFMTYAVVRRIISDRKLTDSVKLP